MVVKILAICSLVLLPLSLMLWRSSHKSPAAHRFDVTPNKSLRVYIRDGVFGLRLLTMPKTSATKSEFHSTLAYDAIPNGNSFLLSSRMQGVYRVTWVVFPFWLTSTLLTATGTLPIVRGPCRQRWRRWKGSCLECGYDLTGNRSGRCPECGTRLG